MFHLRPSFFVATEVTSTPRSRAIPLAAALTVATVMPSAVAENTAPTTATPQSTAPEQYLPVVVTGRNDLSTGRDSLATSTTMIGKSAQALRDVPQSLTVVTEKLIADRNLDTVKEALHSTAGVTFLAGEGGEEDIRLRGFSLAGTGDIFVDGMRDPAFYDRDTFNLDRLELLRGSASMLFGRGSTGGAANQVSKVPTVLDERNVALTVGNHDYMRVVGDLNQRTGEHEALRIVVMGTRADNNGSGSRLEKTGIAGSYRWGIGERHEFLFSLYQLDNENGINYGIPWVRLRPKGPTPTADELAQTGLLRVDPSRYYGASSDYNHGSASFLTLSHTWRLSSDTDLKTVIRPGHFNRDQRASAIRFAGTTGTPANATAVYADNVDDSTVLTRGVNNKIQQLDTFYGQSDLSTRFAALGVQHAVLAGVDVSRERFQAFSASTATTLGKPRTYVGTPDDGGGVDEAQRELTLGRTFRAETFGVYAQDMITLAPAWKLLLGLRHDNFNGAYWQSPNLTYQRSDSLWSRRAGVLFQPDATQSYHFSSGTSFNTSGDTYQYDSQTANTPPEGSVNYELGARFNDERHRWTARVALFYAIKLNERNRDPDSAATQALLSGRRHTAGFEVDLAGRLNAGWEAFVSYAWTPIARIDVGAPGSTAGLGEGAGTRSSLTPRHSGTIWTTYQLNADWRLGGGINFRSSQTPNRNPGWAAPAFATLDLMAEYRVNDTLTVKGNAANVTNKRYADALYTGHYIPGAGRLLQLTFSASF